jgi:predicted enzyme related to lactoylglutathione lyase
MSTRPHLIEFPADDPERARRFWAGLLETPLEDRAVAEGEGWQTREGGAEVGVHTRGRGPGDTNSLPYFAVEDLAAALERVAALGGSVVHPGARWAVCRDSEGSPFGLAAAGGLEPVGAPAEQAVSLPDAHCFPGSNDSRALRFGGSDDSRARAVQEPAAELTGRDDDDSERHGPV